MAKYILLDTETTGAGEADRICQLAFLVLDKKETKVYNSLCKPPLPISYGAMAVHHITQEAVDDKPPYASCEAAAALNGLNTPENIMIIQNAPFDLGMLKKEGFEWQGKVIDTFRCIKHLEPDMESHALQYLRYAKGFYKEEAKISKEMDVTLQAHDALSDVIVLKQLMSYLVSLAGRNIEKLVELTKKPILYKALRFGKHKDVPLLEVALKDRGYLEWALSNMDLDDDYRFSIKHAIIRTITQSGKSVGSDDAALLGWALENHEMFEEETIYKIETKLNGVAI